MLKWRLFSAAIIITLLLGLLHLDYHYPLGTPGVWLLPLIFLVTGMMTHELLDLWRDRSDRPIAWPVYGGAWLVLLATSVPLLWPLTGHPYPVDCPIGRLGWPLIGMGLAVGLAFIGEMTRYTTPGRSTGGVALSVFAVSYAGLLMSFLVQLRLFRDSAWGMAALLSLIVVVKVSDTCAYFTGRMLGRHKMSPVLSPKKTIEGAIGGFVGACLASCLCFAWILPKTIVGGQSSGPWWGWIVYGIVVTAAGMTGDLAESLLKRDSGHKDSSSWLPGLGGVLDILDSVLFAALPAYLCWVAGIVGPGAGG